MEFSLSVVIPNYNNESYIKRCVKSVLAQTYKDLIEIIIVDDCSTDSSREIIMDMANKNSKIRPIFLEKNGKVSAARNIGLKEARGEYITFVDSDDFYYDDTKLENEMSLIKKYFSLGKDIASYSTIVRCTNDEVDFFYPNIPLKSRYVGNVYKKLIYDIRSDAVMRDYCIRKEILNTVGGYNENNSLFEDYELLLKLSKIVEFYYTNKNGTVYRNSINGLSQRPVKELVSKKNEVIANQIATETMIARIKLNLVRSSIQLLKNLKKQINRRR